MQGNSDGLSCLIYGHRAAWYCPLAIEVKLIAALRYPAEARDGDVSRSVVYDADALPQQWLQCADVTALLERRQVFV